ncbi:MAG: H-NS family nucleoid-associated regulatory protein [Hyphomicrobium sp.]
MFKRKPMPDAGQHLQLPKDLHEMTYDELASQKLALDAELVRRGAAELETMKAKLVSIAAALGVSLSDLFGPRSPSEKKERKQRQAKARYRDPDTGETWSGLGKPKKWLQQKLDAGHSIDEFLTQ